jgi:hypothetical protein
MYHKETKATSHTSFGHLSFEYLIMAWMAVTTSEVRDVNIYVISEDLF